MIFDELVLHNFGVYGGEHRVALTPSPGRPIVLFGALNGSGKTTFMDGMQLALYGKASKTSSRGRLGYHEYLARLVNRYSTATEGAGLQFAFRQRSGGRDEAIRLIRTWSASSKGVKENFEVWRDEVLDHVATERWSEFVEDFIPLQISDLFFFDGEKIEGLADPEQSAELLKVGLHALLGLDLVDHLVRSLGVIERRRKAAQLSAPERAAIDQAEGEIAALERQHADFALRIAGLRNELDQCARKVEVNERELESVGGSLLTQRKGIEEKLKGVRTNQATIGGQLIELCAGDAPLLLVMDLMRDLSVEIANSVAGTVDPAVYELISKRDRETLKKLAEIGTNKRHIDSLKTFLEHSRPEKRAGTGRAPSVTIAHGKVMSVEVASDVLRELEEKIRAYDKLSAEIEGCERNLAAVPQEESVRAISERLQLARQEHEKTLTKLDLLTDEQRKLATEIDRKKALRHAKLEEVAGQILSMNITHRVLKHSGRVRETLGKYREEIAKSHMLNLEQLITNCFAQLHRKKGMKHTIVIDRNSYELRLSEDGTQPISSRELSAGERQLLAVSVLWALAQASGRKLPTVIDTPLGRLDSTHRHYLVENYFPKASHQVILFSTDEEIVNGYYQQLKSGIAREYSIVFDEGRRSSMVVPGYFAKEAIAA